MGKGIRFAIAAALIAAAAAAFAQVSPPRITGEMAGSDHGGSFTGWFDCTGSPTCQGTYRFVIKENDCSNTFTRQGRITITGMNLAAPGPLQGTFDFADAEGQVTRNPDGSCTPTAALFPYVRPYTGQFDGSRGTFLIPDTFQGQPSNINGTFKLEPPPPFPMSVTTDINPTMATASAQIQYRSQDVGTQGSVFVFAMAPASRVQGAANAGVLRLGYARDERKAETPIGCVLAQLNAAGQMVAVSSANLVAYLTGVLSAQGASVSILNGVPTGNVSGATFFVGYGPNATSMINTGVNRAAVTVPGSLECRPAAPQTGWWWNPAEDGRGFSIEKRGNNLFFAAFLYHSSGRSTWHVSSGPVSLEGTLYNGDLLAASGGQTLGGAYPGFPTLRSEGSMTMTFNNESTGTLVWPGGTVPIQRFNIIPNGLAQPSPMGTPESGWWWNEQEAGRGFFMEWQGGTLDIAGYMYDDDGNPVWYLTVGAIGGTASARSFSGTWWSYGNGMTLSGPWRPHTRTNANVAPVTITFTGADTAIMTLPNSRTTTLKRHQF